MRKREKKKQELVAEYVTGEMSYREMEERYGVSSSTLQRWVSAAGAEAARAAKAGGVGVGEEKGQVGKQVGEDGAGKEPEDLGAEVRRLRGELRKAELHAKLLNAMIDIAEERFEIPIRKKRGAKR
jgi:transposase